MTEQQTELARRLVAYDQWRWVPGMAVGHICPDGSWSGGYRYSGPPGSHAETWGDGSSRLPDLSDYATAAILLRMAMEALWDVAYLTDLHPNQPEPGRVWEFYGHPTATAGEQTPDLGTAAAKALLALWADDVRRIEVSSGG